MKRVILNYETHAPITELKIGEKVLVALGSDNYYVMYVDSLSLLKNQTGETGFTIEGPDEDGYYSGSCLLDLRRISLANFN
jgi:hypothetical protein